MISALQSHHVNTLVELRRRHETETSRESARKSSAARHDPLQLQDRREMADELRGILLNENKAVGTGLERNARWKGKSGNALNAALSVKGRAAIVSVALHLLVMWD